MSTSPEGAPQSHERQTPAPLTREEKVLSALCHLAYLPVITVATLPLIVWVWKRDESEFVGTHAWQAFVYQGALTGTGIILFGIGYGLRGLLSPLALPVVVGIAILFGLLVAVVLAVPSCLAAWNAGNGELYDYPVLGALARRLM